MTAIRRARELLPAESLGADKAAPSNCFESIPGGTRFAVSKLQPQVSRGTQAVRPAADSISMLMRFDPYR